MWGETATFTMSTIFDGTKTSASVSSPVNASVSTTTSASNADDGALGSDGNYFQIVLTDKTFSSASINGFINTTSTDKNWGFQFSTDGGSHWGSELTQANDGIKSAHDIAVGVSIPSGANGFRVIRRAGTQTKVLSITLTLDASCTPRTFKSGEKIFFKDASGNISGISAKWKADGNNIYAYFWNATENAWSTYGNLVSGSWNEANAIYEFTVPGSGKEYTKVLFTRGSAATWEGKTHQTSDQQPCVGENMYIQNTSAAVDGKYNGSWNRYSPSPALIGDFNDWDPDQGKFVDGRVILELEAETDYEFKVLNGDGTNDANYWSCTLCGKATNTVDPWQQLYTNQNNWSMRSAEAGEYCFHWNNDTHYLGIYYPQARLRKNTYIYFDVTRETYWNKAAFDAKFYFKYYDSGSDLAGMPLSCSTPLENYVYYAVVPNNDYVGRIQMNRYVNSSEDGITDVCHAYSRSSSLQNCMKEETGKENYKNSWTPQWTTYCPPMSSATLSDNSTVKISWQTGDGTSGNPYLVDASGTIKVSASATKAVPDDNMTPNYDFKVSDNGGGASSAQSGTGTTYDKGSLSNNHTYEISLDAWNSYNETNGTKNTSATHIWYKALTTYSVTHTLSGVTKSTGREGAGATAYHQPYTATYAVSTGYTMPATITVKFGSTTKTAGTDYTWNSSTGELNIFSDKINGNVTVIINGVAKTTAITLEAGEGGTDGSATATYGTNTITDYVATTRTGYTLTKYQDSEGYNILTNTGTLNTGDKGDLIKSSKWAYDGATVTLYAQWTAKEYSITLDRNGASTGSTSVTMTYNSSSHSALTAPTKDGFTFNGWYDSETDDNGSGNLVMDANGVLQANVTGYTSAGGIWTKDATCTLYAKWTPEATYIVTYDYQGATGGNETVSNNGNPLPNPSKAGYSFAGWYASDGTFAGAGGATSYVPTADITLHAQWQSTTCAGGGGSGDPVVIKLFDGSTDEDFAASPITVSGVSLIYTAYDKPAAASATDVSSKTNNVNSKNYAKGYQFSNTSIDNGNPRRCVQFTIPSGYTATFTYAFGASGNNRTIMIGSSVITSTGDAGYIATLATTGASGGNSVINGGTYSTPLSAGTYYICGAGGGWQVVELIFTLIPTGGGSGTCYYVTYNGNGADGGFTTDEASHASGSNVTVKTNGFTKTGYRFTGWKTEPSGGTSYAAGGTISGISGHMTLYAQWEEEGDETTYYLVTSMAQLNATDTYIIANSAGTAVMSTTPADTDKNPDDITSGFSVVGSTLTVTSASPNLFKLTSATNGWLFKGGNGSGNYLSSDGTPDADLWYNTSSTPPNNTGEWAVSFSEGIATMKLGKTAETTYHIYYDATNTKFIQSTTASNIKIYTSNSTPVYTVTYANGGSTSGSVPVDASSPYEENAEVTVLGNTGSLTKDGYTFGGWSADVDLVIDEATATAGTTIAVGKTFPMPAEDVTLTAVWTPNTYDITYNLNGASWAGGYSAPANYTVGTGATLPVAGNMTNTGYTFGGWYANSSLTGSAVTNISTSDYGNKEFWAKWTENTYTVTYNKNGGSGEAMENTVGHYVRLSTNTYTAPSGKIFVEWNTNNDGTGDSYGAGEDIELEADMTLYAIWADDYTISWGIVQLAGAGAEVTPNLGGGNYTITASVSAWTGTLTADMIMAVTEGVTITNVTVDNSASPKTATVTFSVGANVAGESITLEIDVPAAGVYGAQSSPKEITIDRCTGSGSGSDGVLFSAEFKDSGLGASNICDAANTPYTFTTTELKSAPTGGSIKAYTTSNLSHMMFATNAISIAGSNGVIQIDLDNAIQTNDLFTYVNVNSSSSSAYLRHTTADNETDQIALTGYNSHEKKVMLPAGYNGKKKLYLVRNSNNFNLHKAAVVRPAFLMLLRDDTPTASSTNLEGTDVELTTSTYLATIQGGHAYYTSPSSGNLKIKRSNSKNYIQFNSQAGYIKVVLDEALQEGDVIGFDSYNTNNLALTTTDVRSTSIVTTNQLYTVGPSSPFKGETTFYIWQYGGSSDFLRGLQIARSGIAGGGGGTDKITPTLSWETDLTGGESKRTSDGGFVHTASQDKNSLGTITYSSNNTAVATVNATTGEVHLEGAAGEATITATIAASGCYNTASVSYVVTVEDDCDDVAGTITTEDLGCAAGIKMTVTGHTAAAGVSYQWYKVGTPSDAIVGTDQDNYTTSEAGSYYVIVTNTGVRHCAKRSRNTVEVAASASASATKIVDSWYVKNGRRTPDVALVQTTGATDFIVKNGETIIWESAGSTKTGFGGCGFHMDENGIIYLNGTTAEDGSGDAPNGLTGDGDTEDLKITAKGCGGDADELSITIHKQVPAEGARPSIAFVVDGTEKGTFAQANASHSTNSALFKFLDYGDDSSGAFDLTACNIYSTTDEKDIRQHYSQFDAIIITDDPNTKKNPENKNGDYYKNHSYVNAFGTMIDVRPILSMEAFVSRLANWSAKGVAGDPSSPNPRPYEMRLQCKDHEIYTGLPTPAPGTHVWIETIDDEEYRHVVMVDKTKSPYTGLADNEKTSGDGEVPALQGFAASAMGDLLGLGVISEGALQAAIERQEEPAARMMLLGVNAKALPNALTEEGKKVIENALKYLLKTNMEEVDDCSNFFKGGDPTNPRDWNTAANWVKSTLPNYETKVRILAPCEVSGIHVRVAQVDIATSGTSSKIPSGTCSGSLTIKEDGALIVGGKVRTAEAPRFAANDLKPTTASDLKVCASSTGTGALIFDNSDGKAQATIEMYSASYWETEAGKKKKYWSYVGVPIADVEIPDYFYLGFTYLYDETSGWIKKWDGSVLQPFEGIGLSMQAGHRETFRGTLASTKTKEITLTKTDAGGKGENLIGNSWTAPIQIANFETADFGGATPTVYIYNTGRDDVYQNPTVVTADEANDGAATAGQWVGVPIGVAGLSGYTGLKVIPAMNAFQVNTTSEATLTLDYDKLVRKNAASNAQINNPLRAPRRDAPNEVEALMRVRVSGEKTHTDVWLLQDEQFSDDFDNGWEAIYAVCDNRSAQLYAVSELGQMAFIAKPDLEGTPIGFAPSRDGNVYTFSFQYTGDDTYYLNDLKEEKSTLIEAENTYLFTYEAGEMSPRFLISTTPFELPSVTTGVGNVGHSEKAQKIIYNDHVYIIRGGKIYDVMGKMMK